MAQSKTASDTPVANRHRRDANGESEHRIILLRKRLTIGRSEDCDVLLSDASVSRHHAVIESSDDGFIVRDTGSRAGTFVNARLCESHELIFGDRIQIGPFVFRFAGRRL